MALGNPPPFPIHVRALLPSSGVVCAVSLSWCGLRASRIGGSTDFCLAAGDSSEVWGGVSRAPGIQVFPHNFGACLLTLRGCQEEAHPCVGVRSRAGLVIKAIAMNICPGA